MQLTLNVFCRVNYSLCFFKSNLSVFKQWQKKLLFLFFTFFTLNIYAQNVTMTGTVVDVENLPLIGVNVIIKGSTVGTTTDLDGNFSLEGKKGDVLVFSYIGMVSQEIAFKGQPLKIIMKDDSEALDEVVVIGYQSVKNQILQVL